MEIEEILIIDVLKNATGQLQNNGDIEHLLKSRLIDWQKVARLLSYHEIASFAYIMLKAHQHLLPPYLMQYLRDSYLYHMLRNEHLLQEFLKLTRAFSENKIIVASIKGVSHLMDIYSNPSLRGMCDIDLLVREEDVSGAEKIFSRLGYKKELLGFKEDYWREKQYHLSFYKRVSPRLSFMVELHWALDYKRKNKILPRLWQRLRTVNIDDRDIYLLSPEDTFFSLALHNRRLGKALCLKNIVDLALLLNKYKGFDWDYILKEAKEGNMSTSVFFILSQMKIFLEFNLPASIENSFNLPYWKKKLIYRFISRNSFLPPQSSKRKELYLQNHFLLYDNFWEPIEYIFKIPQEQFAKFYGLKPYDKKTTFFYKNRLIYIPFKASQGLIPHGISKKR